MSSDFELDPLEVAASGQKIIEIAGEALTNRQLVRYNANGQLVTADASAVATLPCIGMTLAVAAQGQRVEVLLRGYVGLATWTWTAGNRLYVGDVAGSIVEAAGTVTQEIGVARSATQIWFHPQGIDTAGGAGVGDTRTSTIVVAASDSLDPTLAEAAYRCDGAADDVEINAAIAALPAGGGRVMLLEGTFNITADIPMVDGLTFGGQGYGTEIFQVAGSNLGRMIGNNAGRNNVTIENLYLDGNRANQGAGQYGIQFALATNSVVKNCWVVDCLDSGIKISKDGVKAENNFVSGCGFFGIEASQTTAVYYTIIANNVVFSNDTGGIYADGGVVTGNLAYDNGAVAPHAGIFVAHAAPPTLIVGNTCIGNYNHGIMLGGDDTDEAPTTISGNTCIANQGAGIYTTEPATHRNTITGNICWNNDQSNANFSGINITGGSSYNIITGNSCSDDQGPKTQNYGIDIDEGCVGNVVKNNTLAGNAVGPVRDLGTDTVFATKVYPFIAGGDVEGTAIWASFVSATASAKGWSVTGSDDWAVALGHLPLQVQQIMRTKIWAVALGAPINAGGQMHLEIVINAGADDLAFNTATAALANVDSETTDYVNGDVIHWVVTGVGGSGMSTEFKVIYEDGSDPDGATNAVFRAVEVEYV